MEQESQPTRELEVDWAINLRHPSIAHCNDHGTAFPFFEEPCWACLHENPTGTYLWLANFARELEQDLDYQFSSESERRPDGRYHNPRWATP